MNRIYFLWISLLVLLFSACNQNKSAESKQSIDNTSTNYNVPKAPSQLQDEEAKINYVFVHFWDNFNFSDTTKVFNPDYGEQAIVDYLAYFPLVRLDTLREGVEDVFNQAKIDNSVFEFFKYQFENYLSNPNSPMRNDLFYEVVLEYLISSEKISAVDKIKYESLLPLVRKNKPGTIATDFSYINTDGRSSNLKSIKAPFTLLMFYEPGCSVCEETINQLKNNPGFNDVIEKGGLTILAIYPDGNEEIWRDYQSNIPGNWINGLDKDQAVVTKGLYMIKATPTIYLLDKDKRVILKDSNLNHVIQFFQNI